MSNHSCTPALTHHVRLPSPVPWRSRHIGREVITEWVVEKATMATVYPILTRTNYAEWSLVMRVNLQVAGMWDVINKGAGNNSEDRNTLTVLLQTVPPEMQAGLAVKNSVKEAWEVIHSMRIGVDKVKEANAERLRQEFNDISFKSGECVEDFALQISDLANQLSHWVMIFWTRKWSRKCCKAYRRVWSKWRFSWKHCLIWTLCQFWRRSGTCRWWIITRRRSLCGPGRMLEDNYSSSRNNGGLSPSHIRVRSPADVVVAEMATVAAVVMAVAVDAAAAAAPMMRNLNRWRSGKMLAILMDRQ
jgi:hypothetical protein